MRCQFQRKLLGQQTSGAGFKNLLQEPVCDALEYEVPDYEARHYLGAARIALGALLHSLIK